MRTVQFTHYKQGFKEHYENHVTINQLRVTHVGLCWPGGLVEQRDGAAVCNCCTNNEMTVYGTLDDKQLTQTADEAWWSCASMSLCTSSAPPSVLSSS